MAQDEGKIAPLSVNTDVAYDRLNADEAAFRKGLTNSINANPVSGNGTNNPTGEGQNHLVLTPSRSNVVFPNAMLPVGANKKVGGGESVTTHEYYYANYNSNGNHGWYVLSGDTGLWSTIIIDSKLSFSDNQANFISEHRIKLRAIFDENGNVVEKYLVWTDGQVWQGWIDVIAAINTNGFDVGAFPYWALQPPHFDREELFQYAFRPPMVNPIVTKIANTSSDIGKLNLVLDNAFEICYEFGYTDGRITTISPYSAPAIVQSTDFLSDPDVISKNLLITLYAGSPLVEYINIYYRQVVKGDKGEYNGDITTWTDWYLYDTIYKFTNSGNNATSDIGNKYWLRTGQWTGFNYDPIFNTIQYIFNNSKVGQITDQSKFDRDESSLPLLSVAMGDLGDSIAFANNKYDYDNFDDSVIDALSITVEEDDNSSCNAQLRTVTLYAMAVRERGTNSNGSSDYVRNIWISQPGFHIGPDPQMRFGGVSYTGDNSGGAAVLNWNDNLEESKFFNLDFADQDSFTVYIKGTQYSAVGEWYVVNNTPTAGEAGTLTKIDHNLDSTNTSDQAFIDRVYKGGGMFVAIFKLVVPAGRYIACLGRHNVPSTEDFRSQSTYVMGIANSKLASIPNNFLFGLRTITHNDIVDTSKEMEIDCTGGDVDVWGNGNDLFMICTPFQGIGTVIEGGFRQTHNNWSFIEGYLFETAPSGSNSGSNPVEKFNYALGYNPSNITQFQYNGLFTDKNGFFWGYAWVSQDPSASSTFLNATISNIIFNDKIDCQSTVFTVAIPQSGIAAWKHSNLAYLVDYNPVEPGKVGFGSYVALRGRITDLTGSFGYSNVAVSIKDGSTAYTKNDGTYELIIHNGSNTPRQSNVYINGAGDFNIFINDCGFIPLFYYDENSVPCQILTERMAPPISLSVNAQTTNFNSLKSNASYVVCVVGADKGGRLTFANAIDTVTVPSFLSRGLMGDTKATFFKWALTGALGLDNNISTKDIAYLGFATTLPTNYRNYVQWVGDSITYYDQNNTVTLNTSEAVLVGISIQSLLNANVKNNLSYLATYQFTKNDRLRIYDNGDGVLLYPSKYGDMIDVEIQGTNYNQAAINANLIVPPVNTVLPSVPTAATDGTTLFVSYDSRFDTLQNDTGFWIELYTPSQNNKKLPVFEITWYPIVKGEIAVYTGGGIDNPTYDYLTSDNLNYWDTYLIKRSIAIPNVGDKFIGHPFESPNITDTWGAKASSGGRANAINQNALQMWYLDDVIRSDDFISRGKINGLGTFREENRKSFKGYQRGGIMAISCQYSVILFVCENDWFMTNFNYQYIYANAEGVQIANLDDNLSVPQQKVGSNFGCSYADTDTVVVDDKNVFWYDRNNEGYIQCNYADAKDISNLIDKDGRMYGIKSYVIAKTKFITQWNNSHDNANSFDVTSGIDRERNNIYLTFRPRRKNTNDATSYVSNRRNIDLAYQETWVYNLDEGRWTGQENFCPESYGKIRGAETGIQLISFAAGIPYTHNSAKTFLNYYGVQTEPSFISVFNKSIDDIKILQALSQNINNGLFYIDMVYDSEENSFSYVPSNLWQKKEKMTYAALLRDMVSYFAPDSELTFRSTLQDGKRIFGNYFVIRFVGSAGTTGQYFELLDIDCSFTNSAPTKP